MTIIESAFMDLTAELDVDAFWAENEQCFEFTTDKPALSGHFLAG